MPIKDIIIFITIHIIVPIIGIALYGKIYRKMGEENIPKTPDIALFLIFAIYGGLLLEILTAIFWKWSGMAAIGGVFLMLGAPVLMGIIAISLFKDKGISPYHYYTWLSSILYLAVIPLFIAIGFIFRAAF